MVETYVFELGNAQLASFPGSERDKAWERG